MAMQFLRNSSKSGFLKYILLGFLVLAGGGLILTDVGGFFRGGLGQGDVGRVGSEKISVVAFDRALRGTLTRIGISPLQAFKAGYIDQMLREQIRDIVLRQAAAEQDILVSREYLAQRVDEIVSPFALNGKDKQGALQRLLRAQGLTEAGFVASIADDVGSEILTAAVNAGFASPMPGLARDVALYENEERSIKLLTIAYDSIELPEDPAPEELEALYESSKERYAIPETRDLKLLKLNDEALKTTIEITEEDLRTAYELDVESYKVEETRTIQQALLPTAEEAGQVIAAVKDGKTLEEAAKEISDTAYLGESDFTKDGVLEEIKDVAFNAEIDEVSEPVKTTLGYQVMIVKAIREPYTKSFEEVAPILKEELLDVALADQMFGLAGALEDLVAGGASLEEIQNEVALDVTLIEGVNRFGSNGAEESLFEDEEMAASRDFILEEGFALLEGETSTVTETQNGDFIAVHVAGITPRKIPPLEDVRGLLVERWIADQRRVTAQSKAEAFLVLAEAGEKSLEQIYNDEGHLELIALQDIKRDSELPSPLAQDTVDEIFRLAQDEYTVIAVADGFAVAQLIESKFPEDAEAKEEDAFVSDMQSEAMDFYLQHKSNDYGVAINRSILERLYGPNSQEF